MGTVRWHSESIWELRKRNNARRANGAYRTQFGVSPCPNEKRSFFSGYAPHAYLVCVCVISCQETFSALIG